ncbi:hypothetical protein BpHYR1_026930 [Brachionus plicatilis]|uniref:Uncharacterized protein n=1 Tax=Brachionus plicatilis TaxID=10195 RepID=A0A3M7P8T8_BRAPC|nr:hypothetical protein BpHYR1_026930 [Brachionus plicatilis]
MKLFLRNFQFSEFAEYGYEYKLEFSELGEYEYFSSLINLHQKVSNIMTLTTVRLIMLTIESKIFFR